MKSILSILVVAVFLASQVGFTLATHYCGSKIADRNIGITNTDLSCGMEDESVNSCENERQSIKSLCCDDELQSFLITDEFKTQTEEVQINQPIALTFIIVFFDLVNFNSDNYSEYLNYHPPKLKRDIPVLIQSFLL